MMKRSLIPKISNLIVLLLSVILIVWISYDTLNKIDLLRDSSYMSFQFWMCMFFILDFFIGLHYADDRWHYFRNHLIFLFLSVPFLNILNHTNIELGSEALYFIRFIPLARGALAMAIVVRYLSSNTVSSVFFSYLVILATVCYFCSLILFDREYGVNPDVTNYGTALWWACMQMTTVGCYINPVTPAAKVVEVILPICGTVMFPLFTVYFTNYVTRARRQSQSPGSPT